MNNELERRNRLAEVGGGESRRKKQREEGKLNARERIALLLDDGTFEETDRFVTHRATDFGMEDKRYPGDGIVTGYGRIDGRTVFVFAQDFTVFGGSLSRGERSEDCEADGYGAEGGRAGDRAERLGRGADSGRGGVAGRVRGHFSAEHDGERGGAADHRRSWGRARAGRCIRRRLRILF
jgi:hypothetical protein